MRSSQRGGEAGLSLSLEMDFTRSTREINAVKIQEGKLLWKKSAFRTGRRRTAFRLKSQQTKGIEMSNLTIPEIADMLRPSAEVIARELLPGGKRVGVEWHCSGSQSPTGEAIGVVIKGSKQGLCCFFGSNRGGDLIELAQEVLGLDKFGAVSWAKQWLGLPTNERRADPELTARCRLEAEERRKARDAEKARERADRIKSAWQIWHEAEDHGRGFDYLRYRGIDPDYADVELRSHPDLSHSEGGSFPALIGKVTDAEGEFCGIWRIYVAKNGKGKAPVEAPKMGLGVARGGAVRIGGVGHIIGIAEGIETALAVRQLVNEQTGITFPVWAALSANGMQSVEIPSKVFQVKIFPDHDQPTRFLFVGKPSVGMTAAKGLATRLQSEGVSVSIIAPARGTDWLDRLNAIKAA